MTLQLREWTAYILVILASLLLLILLKPTIKYKPCGITLPMTQQTIKKIQAMPGWPTNRVPTAWVNAEYHTGPTMNAKNSIISKVTQLAASFKNSSIVITPLGYTADIADDGVFQRIFSQNNIAYINKNRSTK